MISQTKTCQNCKTEFVIEPEDFLFYEKIIKHMNEMPYRDKTGKEYRYGEFFPPEFSPFAYNETMAFDFFPLKRASNRKNIYGVNQKFANIKQLLTQMTSLNISRMFLILF